MNYAVLLQMLTTQLVQLSCLAVAIFGLTYWIGRERPHFTHALWALFLLKCLTPPIIASPTSVFSWAGGCFQPKSHVASFVDAGIAGDVPVEGLGSKAKLPPIVVNVRPEEMAAGTTGYLPARNSWGEFGKRIRSLSWFEIAIGTWIAGGLAILLLTGIRFLVFMRLVRRRELRPCETNRQMSRSVQRLAKEVARRLRIRRGVKVKIVDALIGPAILGLVSPTILLPRIVVERSRRKDLEILLAHELVHFRRGDLWWSAIQSICTCLYWCNPLIWIVRNVVNREAEKCCDEETIGSLDCEPGEYARCLLSVLEWKHSLRSAPLLPGVRPVDITARRLERIMRLRHGCQTRCPRWVVASAFLGAILVLPGDAFTWAQQPASEPQKESVSPPKIFAAPAHASKKLEESLGAGDSKKQASNIARLSAIGALPATFIFGGGKGYRVASIGIKDVLGKLSESVDADNVVLKDELLKRLGVPPVPESVSAEMMHLQTAGNSLQHMEATLSLGGGKPNVAIMDKILHVLGTEESIGKVKEQLRHFREFGFDHLVYQVKIIELPTSHLASIGLAFDPSGALESSVAPQTKGVIRASHTETNWSSFCQSRNVTSEQVALLLGADGCSRLSAPKIMAINGQSSEIHIGTERPFVVGNTPVKNEDGTNSKTFQPKVKLVQEGLKLKILGALVPQKDMAQLEVEYTQNEVTGVDTFTFEETDDRPQLTVQQPKIKKSHMSTTLNIELGSTVALIGPAERVEKVTRTGVPYLGRIPLIGGLFKNVSAGSQLMSKVVLITCDVAEMTDETSVTYASPAEYEAVQSLDGTEPIPATSAKVGPARSADLRTQSTKRRSKATDRIARLPQATTKAATEEKDGSGGKRTIRHSILGVTLPKRQAKKQKSIAPPTDGEILKRYDEANGTDLTGKSAGSLIKIVKEKTADYVDPPRFVPLLGNCEHHHMDYKCTIYYIDEEEKECVDLIYVDHNHFYMLESDGPVKVGSKESVADDGKVHEF